MRKEIDIKQGKRKEGETRWRRSEEGGRKERNVAVDKGVSIAVSAASMIRASYNESRGE